MKASEICKEVGLKSLAELAEITGKHEQTLLRWHRDDVHFFKIVVAGAVVMRVV